MTWKKGHSGNPAGRLPENKPDHINPEPVSIPILRRRDPANELVKLADVSKSERFKLQVWSFLFQAKYKYANLVPKAAEPAKLDDTSDEDLLKALETQTKPKRVKSNARPLESQRVNNDAQTQGETIADSPSVTVNVSES